MSVLAIETTDIVILIPSRKDLEFCRGGFLNLFLHSGVIYVILFVVKDEYKYRKR